MTVGENNLSFIDTESNFKYSVNIKFDIGNFKKVNSYVPTAKNIELFRKVMESFKQNAVTRAHLLIGAYGTGKSMFGAVLGTLLSNKQKPKNYDKFINKIDRFDNNLAKKLEREVKDKDPYLVVLPTTENGSFKQSMLLALQQALKKNDLENIFPTTYFNSVLKKLEQWKTEYKDTYEKFRGLLEKKRGESIESFEEKVEKFDQESYQFFIDIYPDLTSGGDFNPFYGCSLEEVYESVNREVRKRGYQGIYVIFDEFNKLLEQNINTFDSKQLQDFAELATNSEEEEIHLLLISHKKIVQYTTSLTEDQINEWKKVQERFKTLDANEYSSQIYELMSNVIIKKGDEWEKFKERNQEKFDFYKAWINKLNIAPDHNKEEKEKYILKGCYPLHPLTTVLLPKLSQKVAQNERTIFTYLSTEEEDTLGEFIQNNNDSKFPLLKISSIYDYFEDLMQQELDYTSLHQAWVESQRALQKIDSDECKKREFIKSLGVITAVNNFSEIPPSKEILRFALDNLEDDEFEKLVNELINKKIILYRKSLDHFVFFEGSEIDFNKVIKEKKAERDNEFYPKYLLDEYFKPDPIYPKRYNYEYKIRRYFASEYFQLKDLDKIEDWDKYLIEYDNKSYADGMIVYLLLESKEEIKEATELVKQINNSRVIFVLPKKPLDIENLLRDFEAQQLLKEDKDFLAGDSLAEKELNAYITETKQLLNNKINRFIDPYYETVFYYHEGEIISEIKSRKDISEKASNICESEGVFNKTPIINNELVVKDNISAPQKSGRKDIVDRLIFNKIEERLGIEGYRPNFLIYRTVLKRTNLLAQKQDEKKDELHLNQRVFDGRKSSFPKVKVNLKEIIQIIRDELYLSEEKTSFKKIYDKLRKPPYGLRLGVIPILIALAGRINNDLKHVIIRHNGEEKEINAKLFERINKYPARFTIEKTTWSEAKEEYISFLEGIYEKRLETESYTEVNRLKKLYTAIKSWYQALPKYARETSDLSATALTIRRIINKRSSEVKRIILDVIPKKVLNDSIDEENIAELKKKMKTFFKEHNQAYKDLVRELQMEICNLFSSGEVLSFKESLSNWYTELDKKAKNNTYKREVNSFLNILRKLSISEFAEKELLNEIGETLTGFEIKDWNDKTVEEFRKRIKDIKKEVEEVKTETEECEGEDNSYGFVLFDKNGQKYERRFEEVELDGISKTLENKVKSSFEDIGPAVSDRAKQQILINLLKEMFE